MENTIVNLEQFKKLWTSIYDAGGKPDWSHILPYYDEHIYFRDSIQEIRGIGEFKKMTERLTKRSRKLEFHIHNQMMGKNIIFIEWEMRLSFKKSPTSSIYGSSRITLSEKGKIVEQRDYYDLWGDIFDNIPVFGKQYRKFIRKMFG
ncbi:MAG: nuclear transport factor 2 family protein [Spirochaetales bacterium]|nr:nuclear transport factor 2 family protein [Spirochaetales bacterium]